MQSARAGPELGPTSFHPPLVSLILVPVLALTESDTEQTPHEREEGGRKGHILNPHGLTPQPTRNQQQVGPWASGQPAPWAQARPLPGGLFLMLFLLPCIGHRWLCSYCLSIPLLSSLPWFSFPQFFSVIIFFPNLLFISFSLPSPLFPLHGMEVTSETVLCSLFVPAQPRGPQL